MRFTVPLVVCAEDGQEDTGPEMSVLDKACQRIDHLGLRRAEAKQRLTTLPHHLVEQQACAVVETPAQCAHCGQAVGVQGPDTRTWRTLFGTVTLTSPRLYHGRCQPRPTTPCRPLNAWLTDAVAPELRGMATKWAALVSYGLTARALKDFRPVDATRTATTIQHHTLAVAQRGEDERGEEQWAFVEGCSADGATLPSPDGPMTVGIAGGYRRNWEAKQPHCEVMVGTSMLAFRRDDEDDLPPS
jgi:hypothetical protein